MNSQAVGLKNLKTHLFLKIKPVIEGEPDSPRNSGDTDRPLCHWAESLVIAATYESLSNIMSGWRGSEVGCYS